MRNYDCAYGHPEGATARTVAKLSRVILLAPVVLSLGWFEARHARVQGHHAGVSKSLIPLFVVGFILVVLFNSFFPLPAPAKNAIVMATTLMLSIALAAMGLKTAPAGPGSHGAS